MTLICCFVCINQNIYDKSVDDFNDINFSKIFLCATATIQSIIQTPEYECVDFFFYIFVIYSNILTIPQKATNIVSREPLATC